jgi:parallel beta-helix repeat protein
MKYGSAHGGLMLRGVLLGVLLIVLCPIGWAKTYHVDAVNGNDSNDGMSPSTPWKSIAKVNTSKFTPGDSILFRRGETWREMLSLSTSGAQGMPIVIDSYGDGAPPVISGADLVPTSAWSACGNCSPHIWQASVNVQPNVAIFDGVKGNKKLSKDELNSPRDWFWESGSLFVFSDSNPASSFSNPGIEAGARPSGINLTGISYVTIKDLQISGANATPYAEGAGIWAITVHLTGPTPESLHVAHVNVVNGAGDGIHFENADHCSIDDSVVANNDGAGIKIYHSNGTFPITAASITNNEVHHNHFNGIFIVGCPRGERCRSRVYPDGLVVTGVRISGNEAHDNGAGIYLHETNDSIVANNTAYSNTDASRKGEGYCVGLSGSSSNVVEKNDCYKARLSGIELSIDTGSPPFGSSENVIRYNVVHDDGTHGIFTNYVPSQNNKIIYNLIYNHPQGSCIMANYMGHEIYNNTCYNNREGIHLYISSTTRQTGNISVKNNLIVRSSQYHVLVEPGVQGPIYFSNNDYFPDSGHSFMLKGSQSNFAGWRNNTGQDANSIVEDPKFVSSAPGTSPGDFSLQPSSPAIGHGTDLGSNEERALAPGGSWPNQVALSIQKKDRWDIGAFRHTP